MSSNVYVNECGGFVLFDYLHKHVARGKSYHSLMTEGKKEL